VEVGSSRQTSKWEGRGGGQRCVVLLRLSDGLTGRPHLSVELD